MGAASRSTMAKLVTGAGVILVVGVLALPALGAASAASSCSGGQLSLKFIGQQAATGHRFNQYAFKNTGSATCSLRGYPGAVLLDKRGRVIHSARASVGHWTLVKVKTVAIAPGKRAFFVFTWAAGPFCPGHNFTFYNLRVSPPGSAKTFVWRLGKTSACNNSTKITAVNAKKL